MIMEKHDKNMKIEAFGELLDVLDTLRVKCPWDKKQTNKSLRTQTIEEVYELSEALLNEDCANIKEEIGDVLLHVCFYSKIGEEKGEFDIKDVCDKLVAKLKYRHPHIYGDVKVSGADDVVKNWEQLKMKEKKERKSVLEGVPESLPSLIKSYRMQGKARGVGFDWPERSQVWDKVKEEILEFQVEAEKEDKDKMEDEFGDVMFALVNAARLYKINPDSALERSNRKFKKRFNFIEESAAKEGRLIKDLTLEEMDNYWNLAKEKE